MRIMERESRRVEVPLQESLLMWKSILYFLLINLGYIALVITVYAIGYEYDHANQIYPESVQLSYDLYISGIYGQRWGRFAEIALSVIAVVDLVVVSIWYLKRPARLTRLEINARRD